MNANLLKKLHKEQVTILDQIVEICEKNNLKYLLFYGTLLGAVRHKGFIPWDDDIDIVMPREDYDKFLQIAPKELNHPYVLDYITSNKKYYYPFAKVRNCNTIFNEKNSKRYKGNKGIFVDIFPLDYVDSIVSIKVKFCFKAVYCLSTLMAYKSIGLYKKNIFINAAIFISKIIPNFLLIKFMMSLIKGASSKKETNNLVCFCCPGVMSKLCYNTNDVFPTQKVSFENKKYNGANNNHNILTKLYDQYMELPPENKRITHNPVSIKFTDSEEYFFKEDD